jgi:hypothetical protein
VNVQELYTGIVTSAIKNKCKEIKTGGTSFSLPLIFD